MSGRVQSVTRQPSDVITIHPRSDAWKVGGTGGVVFLSSSSLNIHARVCHLFLARYNIGSGVLSGNR